MKQSFNGGTSNVRKAIDLNTGKQASGWSPVQIQQVYGSWSEPYTWHHDQDGKTMYPVPSKIHSVGEKDFNIQEEEKSL